MDWSSIKCICLDVDSTVCVGEGLDELGNYLGVGETIKKLTEKAMSGELDFTEALEARLLSMDINEQKLNDFIDTYSVSLTPGIENLIQRFKENGIDLYLVSGGLYPIVNRVAKQLNIPEEKIYANKLIFNNEGVYVGLDHSLPTSCSNGKALIVSELMEKLHTSVMIIGDGMTDAKACPPADVFIGFGINVIRPEVKNMCHYFCTSVDELINLLEDHKILK
ncbi:Phosphoserine phosphatase, chloroplastic [Schistosoma japonicum]|nr:Phosphoserine phosphatase, chloroplastic [Schistosoma japonicum]KAH8876287.1 Phosphoserine phosphatase, chloroplastic [Schistosoma japonicum]